ncbi:MAG: hypothetical protein DRN04_07455 [Thermoprotei archaeon]|nr:MAG: hypothetical protein DRN04_07455 [Thermoprotei archaeon]
MSLRLELEKLSKRHIKVLAVEEIASLFNVSLEEAYRLKKRVEDFEDKSLPLIAVCSIGVEEIYLPHGLNLIYSLVEPIVEPKPVEIPELLDEEYLKYLLLEVPRKLDKVRKPVLIGEPDRFTRNEVEGLEYSLYILIRIAYTYKIPIILVTEDKRLYEELKERREFVQVFP